jgi:hypothetical protein
MVATSSAARIMSCSIGISTTLIWHTAMQRACTRCTATTHRCTATTHRCTATTHRCNATTRRAARLGLEGTGTGVPTVPAQMWAGWAQSRRRCGQGEPSPGAGVAGLGPVPAQMWAGWAQSRRRCGRGGPSPSEDCISIRCGLGWVGSPATDPERQSRAARVDGLMQHAACNMQHATACNIACCMQHAT